MASVKYCRDCGQARPIGEFTRDRSRTDGLSFHCKVHAGRRLLRSKDAREGPPKSRHKRAIEVPDGHKWCPDCGRVKPLQDFVRNASQPSGRTPYCKPCHNVRGKASRDKMGGARTYHLRRRYGITAEEADVMFEAQGGLCAICRTAPAVHVDHDHDTSELRELLCFNCNGGLGQFKDDPEVLRAAAGYVQRHRASPRSVSSRPEPGDLRGQRRPDVSRDRRCSPGCARWKAMQESR